MKTIMKRWVATEAGFKGSITRENINTRSLDCNRTPLLFAIDTGDIVMVRWILANGADPNLSPDLLPFLTYRYPICSNRSTMCKLLIKYGARVADRLPGWMHAVALKANKRCELARLLIGIRAFRSALSSIGTLDKNVVCLIAHHVTKRRRFTSLLYAAQ